MQQVSTTFSGSQSASARTLAYGTLISWDKTTASGVNYFTIGTSTIGGKDIIKSAGGSPVFSDQYAYKDYSSYTVGWTVSKQLGQFPYGMMLSQADITLNNASNMFTPTSGTSVTPLGPNVRIGRPVKLSLGFNKETIYQFTGYSDTPKFDSVSRTVQMHCFDTLDYLNSFVSQSPVQQNKKADAIITTLLAEAGFATAQFVLEQSLQKAIGFLAPQGQTIGTIIQQLCEAEGALFFCDEQGILRFWNRQHFVNNTTPVATFTYSNTEKFVEQDTPIINYVEVKSNPLAVAAKQQIFSSTDKPLIQGIGPNGYNNIANPSFEISTSGWTGNPVRTTAVSNIGLASASGTNMIYNMSTISPPSSDGIGNQATAQAMIWVSTGQTAVFKLTGTPVAGQSITGTPSQTITGNSQWQSASINGKHFALTPQGTTGAWIPSTNLPNVVDAFAAVTASGYVYSIGGYVGGGDTSAVNYAAVGSPGFGSFFPTVSLSGPRENHSAVSYSGVVYTFGGYDSSRPFPTNYLSEVSLARTYQNGTLNSWTVTSPMTISRIGHSSNTYNGYVYSVAGFTNLSTGTVYHSSVEYAKVNADYTLGSWSTTTALPQAIYSHSSVVYNGYMYVFGGYQNSASDYVSTVYYAPINANGTLGSWSTTTALPKVMGGHTTLAVNGYMYNIGGSGSSTNFRDVYYAVINANGTLGSWNVTTSLSPTRSFHTSIASNGYLYVLGGSDGTGSGYYKDTQYSALDTTGVTLTASGTNPFYLDAVSTDTTTGYYDGDSTSNNLTKYTWTGVQGLSASKAFSAPQTLSIPITLSNPVTSVDIPVANGVGVSSYTANGAADGSAADLSGSIILSSLTVSGYNVVATFANTGTTQGYLTSLVLYGTPALPGSTTNQFKFDQNSINSYKLNPANGGGIIQINNDYVQDSSSAAALAYTLVAGYATPKRRFTASFMARPNLQFGDLVQFVNRETGETSSAYIVGITTTFSVNGDLRQELILEERTGATYFTIGTSKISGTDSIAP